MEFNISMMDVRLSSVFSGHKVTSFLGWEKERSKRCYLMRSGRLAAFSLQFSKGLIMGGIGLL